jgi:hypothetical protein
MKALNFVIIAFLITGAFIVFGCAKENGSGESQPKDAGKSDADADSDF